MPKKVKLSIIGAGKVGSTIALLAASTNKYEVYLANRDSKKAQEVLTLSNDQFSIVSIAKAAQLGEITLLTLSDDAIESLCSEIAQQNLFRSGAIVAHCSGALSSDILSSAKANQETILASMHPLQTFPNITSSLKRMEGTYCYYEGEIEAREPITQLIKDLGMNAVEIDKEAKALYHASAVVACNYFAALMDGALDLAQAAGIDRQTMWYSLDPLVTATLDNIRSSSPAKALTGPIARGDKETIKRHLEAIEEYSQGDERLKILYSSMGVQSSHLALKKGSITEEIKRELDDILISKI